MTIAVDHLDLAHLSAGFVTGLVLLSAVVHVRVFAQLALSVAALAIAYVLYVEGVPGLVAYATAGVSYLKGDHAFMQGLLCGKFVAGFFKWRRVRRRRDRYS